MLTVTDLFAGAGGSSSGAEQVPGVRVRMASNHWALAIQTHAENLPHADHDCADISQVDPRRYPATDILWASPECTNHSQAKGQRRSDRNPDLFDEVLPDEAAERSRATMWDVCRFVEAMAVRGRPYRGFVVENVVDVRAWMFYEPWKAALRVAGYCLHEVYLNSMFAGRLGDPAPQSRDRYYCLGHLDGTPCPDLDRWTRPAAYCPTCDAVVAAVQAWKRPEAAHGRYRAQYVYRCPNVACRNREVFPGVLPAAAAIDWTTLGERIGDRAKPLAAKTRARIEAGLRRYGRPIHLEAAGHTFERRPGVRTWPVDEPFRTIHTSPSKALACPPMMVPVEGRDGIAARPVDQPHRTQTARNQTALVTPDHRALLVPAGGTWSDTAASTGEPFRTRTTRETEALVVPPGMVMRNNTPRGDAAQMCTPLNEPVRTITTAGHQSLITWLTVQYNRTGTARPVDEPLGTVTTVDRYAMCSVEIDVDDCLFRMLEPDEIRAAMAFARGYTVLGNKRERVRQLGNAVTPPAARDLIAALAEAITGEPIERPA